MALLIKEPRGVDGVHYELVLSYGKEADYEAALAAFCGHRGLDPMEVLTMPGKRKIQRRASLEHLAYAMRLCDGYMDIEFIGGMGTVTMMYR